MTSCFAFGVCLSANNEAICWENTFRRAVRILVTARATIHEKEEENLMGCVVFLLPLLLWYVNVAFFPFFYFFLPFFFFEG